MCFFLMDFGTIAELGYERLILVLFTSLRSRSNGRQPVFLHSPSRLDFDVQGLMMQITNP